MKTRSLLSLTLTLAATTLVACADESSSTGPLTGMTPPTTTPNAPTGPTTPSNPGPTTPSNPGPGPTTPSNPGPNAPTNPSQPPANPTPPSNPNTPTQPLPANPGGKATFFLPTGEPDNTSAPSVEVDAQGGVHTLYPAYAGGDAYYGYCARGQCTDSDAVKVVHFSTEGTVHNAMIALDPQGRPRVLLSTAQKVYWSSCDSNCTEVASWTTTMILDHGGEREISGEALALDPQGRPRFMMHVYRAYLGVGQKPYETFLVGCDQACNAPASWTVSSLANEIWEGSTLRYDRTGRAHLATVVWPSPTSENRNKLAAYFVCTGGCETGTAWKGIGLGPAFEHMTEAVAIKPTVTMALTRAGAPRIAALNKTEKDTRALLYFECDDRCNEDHWRASMVSDHAQINAGLDIALDANDRPRVVYTLGYNIGLLYCDDAVCAGPTSVWDLTKVELSAEMKPDPFIFKHNCTVSAWFLHSPSIALTAEGAPRVGYQARDISGGVSRPDPDPTKPACRAGTDMTWSRLAVMPSHK